MLKSNDWPSYIRYDTYWFFVSENFLKFKLQNRFKTFWILMYGLADNESFVIAIVITAWEEKQYLLGSYVCNWKFM